VVVEEEHAQWHYAIFAFGPKPCYLPGEAMAHLDKLTAGAVYLSRHGTAAKTEPRMEGAEQ
jgi:hypothetical protein